MESRRTTPRRAAFGKATLCVAWLAAGLALAACAGGPSPGAGSAKATGDSVKAARLAEAGELGDIAFGRADAPVTMIEYASLTCPYCRQFHLTTYPRLKRELIDTGKVRYVIREFPIGRSAGNAALVARCGGLQSSDRFMALFDKFLTQQAQWTSQEVRLDAIYKVAAQTGMSRETFDKCLANQTIIEALKQVKERGRELGVVGTPTFFVNGKKASGALTFEQIKGLIDTPGV